jgi:hypothetical protein
MSGTMPSPIEALTLWIKIDGRKCRSKVNRGGGLSYPSPHPWRQHAALGVFSATVHCRRLMPLTQVNLYVVVGRRQRSDFCWGFRAR